MAMVGAIKRWNVPLSKRQDSVGKAGTQLWMRMNNCWVFNKKQARDVSDGTQCKIQNNIIYRTQQNKRQRKKSNLLIDGRCSLWPSNEGAMQVGERGMFNSWEIQSEKGLSWSEDGNSANSYRCRSKVKTGAVHRCGVKVDTVQRSGYGELGEGTVSRQKQLTGEETNARTVDLEMRRDEQKDESGHSHKGDVGGDQKQLTAGT